MIKITPIPAFENNYFWVIQPDPAKAAVIIVDPGDAQPVLDFLRNQSLELAAIILTHRHQDHIGGVNRLLSETPVNVYGPASAAMPQVSHPLGDGDFFRLTNQEFQVISVPGHTWEHIAYYLADQSALFCGDALFAGGCGRRFDGTEEVMWNSLQKLAALPDDTLIYCAHEYTLSNLRYAAAIEPGNKAIKERLKHVEQLRSRDLITLPSLMGLEKRTNPFLRCDNAEVIAFARAHSNRTLESSAEVFGVIREIRDSWTG